METDPARQVVEQMRKCVYSVKVCGYGDADVKEAFRLLEQAIDTIERLLAERGAVVTAWMEVVDEERAKATALEQERDRLRAELKAFMALPCTCSEHERRIATERDLADAIEAQNRYRAERNEEIITHAGAWREANAENNRHIARLVAAETKIAALEQELRSIDVVMARRPALDKPTRWQNIEHAINTAKRADEAERALDAEHAKVRALEEERDAARAQVIALEEERAKWTRDGWVMVNAETYAAEHAKVTALEQERDKWQAARQRIHDGFRKRTEDGTCACAYCQRDAEALGELAAEYELDKFSAEQALISEQAAHAETRRKLEAKLDLADPVFAAGLAATLRAECERQHALLEAEQAAHAETRRKLEALRADAQETVARLQRLQSALYDENTEPGLR